MSTLAHPSIAQPGGIADAVPAVAPSTPSAPPPIAQAELAQLLGAFNDVTARLTATHEALRARVEQLQAELREANAAVERSRHLAMVGELAAGIAHEVRNPLGSIGLYARMLQEDLADRPAQQQTARKIAGAVERLNAVVGDVLAFARPIILKAEDLDAHDLLAGALEAARADGPEWQGLRIVLPAEARRPPRAASVRADANLMHQALVNIIRNAAQAMAGRDAPRELHLSCARRRVRTGEGAARPMMALCVRDTGPGIPDDVLPRLFQPFFTTRAAGTGLGLAIVHRILDAHGGRVVIANHAHGGAQVELLLPA